MTTPAAAQAGEAVATRGRDTSGSTDASMTGRRAVLVLGSGRSGTSTLACALNTLGVDLGRHLKAPTRKNPRGFFEEVHLLRAIKKVRRSLDLRPESVRLVDEQEWHQPRIAALREQMIAHIRSEFADADVWGFKYGSNGRLLPFWLEMFAEAGIEPAFAFAYRNPLSIARSRSKLDLWRGAQEKTDLEWAVHVIPVLRQLTGFPLVVVDYDRLLDDPRGQLQRLVKGLGLPAEAGREDHIEAFCSQFLDPNLRHSRFDRNSLLRDRSVNSIVRAGALELDALAGDLLQHDDPELMQRWGGAGRSAQHDRAVPSPGRFAERPTAPCALVGRVAPDAGGAERDSGDAAQTCRSRASDTWLAAGIRSRGQR